MFLCVNRELHSGKQERKSKVPVLIATPLSPTNPADSGTA